jgi:DUF2075 family protein
MTGFQIEKIPFSSQALEAWLQADPRHNNWPVVYTISNKNEIYVGETINAFNRLQQHLATPERKRLERVQIILNGTFNKSVCLDLESQLIRYFAADEKYVVLNGNQGISNADYFDREKYQESFQELFDELVATGALTRGIPEIVNSNLFKYSPFKALNTDQAIAISHILEKLFADVEGRQASEVVVRGEPGTGKTIVAIYLMKLLVDIARALPTDAVDPEAIFGDYFSEANSEALSDFRLGLVIPQQSLRKTLENVFGKTPGLSKKMILNPFDVGASEEMFDLLIVDEAHRLGQRANQSAGILNKKFRDITVQIFGKDDKSKTQLDWIRAKSKNRILLVDADQTIKPADLPRSAVEDLISTARKTESLFNLTSQMRVEGGNDYLDFVQVLFEDQPYMAAKFGSYDLRFFDSFTEMRSKILERDASEGLSRLLAGFAWPWRSKDSATSPDIEVEGQTLFWNRTATDWINSKTSVEEVGSIHTVQGYDLNYAGVIIGPDLKFDAETQRVVFDRANYFDVKGKENNPTLGIKYTDEDLLSYVINIYKVLLTRGIKGTYIYVHDEDLRGHLRKFVKPSSR